MSEPKTTDPLNEEEYPPTLTQTFRWANGDEIGDYAWMGSDDDFAMWDGDEPKAYLQESWHRTAVQVHWAMPDLYDCQYEDAEPCEEDAVAWQREGDTWMAACESHRTPT